MRHTPSSSRFHSVSHIIGLTRNLFRRGVGRKLICFALITNLLIWPGADLTLMQFSAFASTGYTLSTGSVRLLSLLFKSLVRTAPAAPQRETLADRLAFVSQIRISPAKFVGYDGEGSVFTAIATDSLGRTVQGVKFTWESSNTNKRLCCINRNGSSYPPSKL